MKAMILAAGRGERMRPLTDSVPKPLLEVGGKPLIVWQIERLAAAGIGEIVINHSHLGHLIEAALGDGAQFKVSIAYSHEPEALETGGGVYKALHLLGSQPFVVASADIYTEYDYARLEPTGASLHAGNRLGHIVLVDNPSFHPKGDFALAQERVLRDGPLRLTYGNIGVYLPEFFAAVTPGSKTPMLPLWLSAIDASRLGGEHYRGVWDNLGTPAQLQDLDRRLRD
jgi:N-acetyl-alpha-D-muramate 1-phosphate uridylyltransferase